AVRFTGQPSKPTTSATKAATLSAPKASRLADWAASPKDSVSAAGGAAGTGPGDCPRMGAALAGGNISAGGGESRSSGSTPIASSAPISTYQRGSASAASRSSAFIGRVFRRKGAAHSRFYADPL